MSISGNRYSSLPAFSRYLQYHPSKCTSRSRGQCLRTMTSIPRMGLFKVVIYEGERFVRTGKEFLRQNLGAEASHPNPLNDGFCVHPLFATSDALHSLRLGSLIGLISITTPQPLWTLADAPSSIGRRYKLLLIQRFGRSNTVRCKAPRLARQASERRGLTRLVSLFTGWHN
jgi:hypothetical protein